jgi:hypothetical protein
MPEGQRGLAIIVKSSWGDARRAEGFGNKSEIHPRGDAAKRQKGSAKKNY